MKTPDSFKPDEPRAPSEVEARWAMPADLVKQIHGKDGTGIDSPVPAEGVKANPIGIREV